MIAVAMILFAMLVVTWLVAPSGKRAEATEPTPALTPDPTAA